MVAAPVLELRKHLRAAPIEPAGAAPGALPRGRLIELAAGSDAAPLSAAVQILLESQRAGDPVAWVQPQGGDLYPPDLAAAGLDLDALLVVHVPPTAGPAGAAKAAELLLRTGAFGALALDVADGRVPRGGAWLGRLASLARERDCRCLLLGPDAAGSLGSLVSLRLRPRRRRVRPGRYALDTEVLRDKSGSGASLPASTLFRGPEGLP